MEGLLQICDPKRSPVVDRDVCGQVDFPSHLPRVSRCGNVDTPILAALLVGSNAAFGLTPETVGKPANAVLDQFGLNWGGQLRHSPAGWQLPIAFAATLAEPIAHQKIEHLVVLLPPPPLAPTQVTPDQAGNAAALSPAWMAHVNERDWQLPLNLPAHEGIVIAIDSNGVPMTHPLLDLEDDPRGIFLHDRLLISALRSLCTESLQTALPSLVGQKFIGCHSSSQRQLFGGGWDSDIFGQMRERWVQRLAVAVPGFADGADLGPIETRIDESLRLARLWMLKRLDQTALQPHGCLHWPFNADRFARSRREVHGLPPESHEWKS
jgi:hypothetical protein